MDAETINCIQCHEPVQAQDALVVPFEDENGVEFMAVFHRPPMLCAPTYALERLQAANLKVQEALKNFLEAAQKAKGNNEQL